MTVRSSSLSLGLIIVSSVLSALGCSASPASGSTARPDATGGGGPITASNGGNGSGLIVPSGPTTTRDPNDTRDVPVRQKTCDANNMNCTCLRLALLGTLDSAAVDTDSDSFVTWLNTNAMGTATLTKVATKPTLDAAFLANYDILLVVNVNGWTFSDAEKAAVGDWVNGSGGGIITLTGFESTATESAASSQLVSFAGMGYSGTTMAQETCPASGENSPVYYKDGTVDLKKCMIWNGTSTGGTQHTLPSITTPIKFTPQTGQLGKATLGLDYVGGFIGWPALAPAGSTVLATDPITGGNMAVAYDQGKGRIFTWGDEWVIFSNQWVPTGTPSQNQPDANNPCYVPASASSTGMAFFHSVQTLYQTKQFWYDVINWVAPPNECNFVVNDPDVIPK